MGRRFGDLGGQFWGCPKARPAARRRQQIAVGACRPERAGAAEGLVAERPEDTGVGDEAGHETRRGHVKGRAGNRNAFGRGAGRGYRRLLLHSARAMDGDGRPALLECLCGEVVS
jgi:hypothetical protein